MPERTLPPAQYIRDDGTIAEGEEAERLMAAAKRRLSPITEPDPAVRWFELDGSIVRMDRGLGQFVATLVIPREVFQDEARLRRLIESMSICAHAAVRNPIDRRHFPTKPPAAAGCHEDL